MLKFYEEIIWEPPLNPQLQIQLQTLSQTSQIRCYGTRLEPAILLALLEQLVVNSLAQSIERLVNKCRGHPFHNNQSHLVSLYRALLYRLTKLLACVRVKYDIENQFEDFLSQVPGTLDAYTLAFIKIFQHKQLLQVFKEFGTNLYLIYYDDRKGQYTQLGELKDKNCVVIVRSLKFVFSFIQKFTQTSNDDKNSIRSSRSLSSSQSVRSFSSSHFGPKIHKKCSLCQSTQSLVSNKFCQHLYCQFCIQQFLKIAKKNETSYKCLKRGCNSRLLKSLINQNKVSGLTPIPLVRSQISFSTKSYKFEPSSYILEQNKVFKNQIKQSDMEVQQQNGIQLLSQLVSNQPLLCGSCLYQLDQDNQATYESAKCFQHLICQICKFSHKTQCFLCKNK